MEFQDEHPADILDINPPGTKLSTSYNPYGGGAYIDLDMTPDAPVEQKMPGKAKVSFEQKKTIFDKPGVQLPDLKGAKLVTSKKTDDDQVEKIGPKDARTRRLKYEVSIGPKMRRGVNGGAPEEFDTVAIKKKFFSPDIGSFGFGVNGNDERFNDLAREWMLKSLIWVC